MQMQIDSKELNGAASPSNCARKIAHIAREVDELRRKKGGDMTSPRPYTDNPQHGLRRLQA